LEVSKLTLSEQKEYLANVFEQWKGEAQQTDDIIILALKV